MTDDSSLDTRDANAIDGGAGARGAPSVKGEQPFEAIQLLHADVDRRLQTPTRGQARWGFDYCDARAATVTDEAYSERHVVEATMTSEVDGKLVTRREREQQNGRNAASCVEANFAAPIEAGAERIVQARKCQDGADGEKREPTISANHRYLSKEEGLR